MSNSLRRLAVVALVAAVGGASAPSPADAGPRTDPRDAMLYARAVRVGRNVATRHLSPEGLLAYEHRLNATPAQLSHDTLQRADTGIWTGCYAASVACRYAVTHDAEALALARRLAAGLDLLSRATGVEGAISRSVGKPIPGEDCVTKIVESPLGGGLAYRNDASRDTLSGIVLGWECLARFVPDPEIRAYAAKNLGAIAYRLFDGGMKVREVDGKTTKFGTLDGRIAGLIPIGSHAAIGCAAVLAGARWTNDPNLWNRWKGLEHRGWDDAIDNQYTWVGGKAMSASNIDMAHLALLVIALEDEGKSKRNAMAALRELRRATRGWQNGAFLSTALLAGAEAYRDETVEELRETLVDMPGEERPFVGTSIVEQREIVPISARPIGVWAWKSSPRKAEVGRESAAPSPSVTFTRADFLFAYWLARAAGELDPAQASTPPPAPGPSPDTPPYPTDPPSGTPAR